MEVSTQSVRFDAQLLQKHNHPTPRYTSYPPATELSSDFNQQDFYEAIARGNAKKLPYRSTVTFPFVRVPVTFAAAMLSSPN